MPVETAHCKYCIQITLLLLYSHIQLKQDTTNQSEHTPASPHFPSLHKMLLWQLNNVEKALSTEDFSGLVLHMKYHKLHLEIFKWLVQHALTFM